MMPNTLSIHNDSAMETQDLSFLLWIHFCHVVLMEMDCKWIICCKADRQDRDVIFPTLYNVFFHQNVSLTLPFKLCDIFASHLTFRKTQHVIHFR